MATVFVTLSNWNDATFWSNLAVANGTTLDMSALGADFTFDLLAGTNKFVIDDGATTFSVGGASTSGTDAILASGEAHSFDVFIAPDGANISNFGGDQQNYVGGSGSDVIDGGGGNDTLYGGDGQDTLSGGDGDDLIEGGAGASAGKTPLINLNFEDGASGTASDDSANGIDGIYQNGATAGGKGWDGWGTGVVLDGTNQYVEIPDDPAFQLTEGTVAIRFNAADISANGSGTLFSRDSSSFDGGGHVRAVVGSDGSVSVRIQDTSKSYTLDSGPGAVTDGQWHHVALSFGTKGLTLYIDGAIADSSSYTGGIAGNTEPWTLGADQQSSGDGVANGLSTYFDGTLDEFAVFDTQLSKDEITALHSGGVGSVENLVSYGNLLEGDAGADTLIGGEHADTLLGGADADTFIVSDGFGNDTITGGEGGTDEDVIDLSALSTGVTVTYDADELGTVTDGFDTLSFSEVEQFITTAFDDKIYAGRNDLDSNIVAAAGNDTVSTDSGNDTVDGGIGNDVITTSFGDDSVLGGAGNDSISSGYGADTVYAGAGDDTLWASRSDGDYVDAGDGSDLVNVVSEFGTDTVLGGEGGIDFDTLDFYFLDYGDDGIEIAFSGAEAGTFSGMVGGAFTNETDVAQFSQFEEFILTDQNDIVAGTANTEAIAVDGRGGDDVLTGGSGSDSLSGGDGADFLKSGAGQDTLDGGDGNDTLMNAAGDDSLVGGAGDDLIVATLGSDTLEGGDGFDTLMGGTGGDSLDGGADDDLLVGDLAGVDFNATGTDGAGVASSMADFPTTQLTYEITFASDQLNGLTPLGSYHDTVGQDQFLMAVTPTNELYFYVGTDGLSTGVDVSGYFDGNIQTFATTWDSATGAIEVFANGTSIFSGTVATGDTLTQGGTFALGQEQDSLGGGFDSTQIFEGTIYGVRLYDDVRTPAEITDTVAAPVADTSDPSLIANWVADHEEPGSFVDQTVSHSMTMSGDVQGTWSEGEDTLSGGDGDDSVYGGGGDDLITGLGGNDLLEGGDGSDRFQVLDGFGNDTVVGGEGGTDADLLDLSGVSSAGVDVTFTDSEDGTVVQGSDTITFSEIEQVKLTDQEDTLDGRADSIGLNIEAGGGADTILGGTGGDTLSGGDGSDYIDGGAGDDSLSTGLGSDTLIGGEGNDTLTNSDGDDSLDGGAGNDSIVATGGDDTLRGGAGDDTMFGGADNDLLIGGSGADSMDGGTGDDTFYGDGADEISFALGGTSRAGVNPIYEVYADGVLIYTGEVTWAQDGPFDPNAPGAFQDVRIPVTDGLPDSVEIVYINDSDPGDGSSGGDRNLHVDSLTVGDTTYQAETDATADGGAVSGNNHNLFGTPNSLTFDTSAAQPVAGNDTMSGGDGSDTFVFTDNFGNDSVVGGEGGTDEDVIDLSGLSGPVTVTYTGDEAGKITDGNDTITFSEIERIILTDQNDKLYGSADSAGLNVDAGDGNDTLEGGSGNDSLSGGAGNDRIDGGTGFDTLDGGDGDDKIDLEDNDGTATVFGGAGHDKLDVDDVDGNGFTVTFDGDNSGTATGGTLSATFSQIEEVQTSNQADTIDASADNSGLVIDAADGDDLIAGGTGSDTVTGGAGNDTITGGGGSDTLDGGAGDDTILADGLPAPIVQLDFEDGASTTANDGTGNGHDGTYKNGASAGGTGWDGTGTSLVLDGTDDYVEIPDNPDFDLDQGTVSVRFNADTISSGDTLVSRDSTMYDGGGHLRVYLTSSGAVGVRIQSDTTSYTTTTSSGLVSPGDWHHVAVTFGDDGLQVYVDGVEAASKSYTGGIAGNNEPWTLGANQWQSGDGVANNLQHHFDGQIDEFAVFGQQFSGEEVSTLNTFGASPSGTTPGNDTIDGGAGDDSIDGGGGDDSVDGGSGNDTIHGGDGSDQIDGGDGDDNIRMGDGDNTVFGGAGNDLIDDEYGNPGYSGNNTVDAGEGNDSVYSGYGDDTVFGGDGDDYINVQWGNDSAEGGAGNDTLVNEFGNSTLSGGSGDDSLKGGYNADSLDGGADDDTLSGGDGDDTLDGGSGNDSLTGGAGNDTFIFNPGDGADTITDFNSGNTGALGDGDTINNDFIDLSQYYTSLSELRADFDDDGVLNQSSGDYSDNTEMSGGDSITFQNSERKDFRADNTGIVCFTAGTLIATPTGEVPIETLQPGDLVLTRDNGPQPLVWVTSRRVGKDELAANPKLKPILLTPSLIGAHSPLAVSRQHGVLLSVEGEERLIRAVHLERMQGRQALIAKACSSVTYFHLAFDRHEIVFANGAPSESFYPGPQAVAALADARRAELHALFPELAHAGAEATIGEPARVFSAWRDLPRVQNALTTV